VSCSWGTAIRVSLHVSGDHGAAYAARVFASAAAIEGACAAVHSRATAINIPIYKSISDRTPGEVELLSSTAAIDRAWAAETQAEATHNSWAVAASTSFGASGLGGASGAIGIPAAATTIDSSLAAKLSASAASRSRNLAVVAGLYPSSGDGVLAAGLSASDAAFDGASPACLLAHAASCSCASAVSVFAPVHDGAPTAGLPAETANADCGPAIELPIEATIADGASSAWLPTEEAIAKGTRIPAEAAVSGGAVSTGVLVSAAVANSTSADNAPAHVAIHYGASAVGVPVLPDGHGVVATGISASAASRDGALEAGAYSIPRCT